MSTNESSDQGGYTPKGTSVASARRTENETKEEKTDPKPSFFQRFMHKHFHDAKSHDRWTLVFTSVIAVSTFLYMVAAIWTLIEIHSSSADTHELVVQAKNQAGATKTLAEAAKNSADLQTQVIKGSQAAELMPSILEVDKNILRVRVMNKGAIKTNKAHITVELSRLHLPSKWPIGKPQLFEIEMTENVMPQNQSEEKRFKVAGYHQGDWQEIRNGTQTLILKTHLIFDNGFGETIERNYCSQYMTFPGESLGTDLRNPPARGCGFADEMVTQSGNW